LPIEGVRSPLRLYFVTQNTLIIGAPRGRWFGVVQKGNADTNSWDCVQLVVGDGGIADLGNETIRSLTLSGAEIIRIPSLENATDVSSSVDGRFWYVADATSNAIYCFSGDLDTGRLRFIESYAEEPADRPRLGPIKGLHTVRSICCVEGTDQEYLCSIAGDHTLTVHQRHPDGKLSLKAYCTGSKELARAQVGQYVEDISNPYLCCGIPGRPNSLIIALGHGDLLSCEIDPRGGIAVRARARNLPENPLGTASPQQLAVSADGKTLFVASRDSELVVVDLK
jgi:hypothetical protein